MIKRLLLIFILISSCWSQEIEIVGSYYDDYLGASGWQDVIERDGRVVVLATAISGMSITAIDYTIPASPLKLSQIVDANDLNGSEYIEAVGNWAINTAIYSNAVNSVDITDLNDIRIVQSLKDDRLRGAAGCVIVEGIWGRGRVLFVAGFQCQSVTAVDISDFTNMYIITTHKDDTNLSGAINPAYKDGKLYVVCRWSKCLARLDVSFKDTIVYTDRLDDPNFARLGGLDHAGDRLYLPCSTTDTLNIVNISGKPYVEGSVSSPMLEGAYVPEVVGDYAIVSARYCNRVTLVDCKNKSEPFVVPGCSIKDDNLLGEPDDVQWFGERCYVTCCVSKTNTVLRIPILENKPPETIEVGKVIEILRKVQASIPVRGVRCQLCRTRDGHSYDCTYSVAEREILELQGQ